MRQPSGGFADADAPPLTRPATTAYTHRSPIEFPIPIGTEGDFQAVRHFASLRKALLHEHPHCLRNRRCHASNIRGNPGAVRQGAIAAAASPNPPSLAGRSRDARCRSGRNNIAFQTNFLALNAAGEAAHASDGKSPGKANSKMRPQPHLNLAYSIRSSRTLTTSPALAPRPSPRAWPGTAAARR